MLPSIYCSQVAFRYILHAAACSVCLELNPKHQQCLTIGDEAKAETESHLQRKSCDICRLLGRVVCTHGELCSHCLYETHNKYESNRSAH